MALEYLVSNGNPTCDSSFLSKPHSFLMPDVGRGEDLIKDEPGEMVLPAVERPLEFSKSVCKDNPAIKFNKGWFNLLKFCEELRGMRGGGGVIAPNQYSPPVIEHIASDSKSIW